ncbi:hypothetical protein [Pararhizobium antarcticum]|uniref:Uncharacterized protein n=1 Tax=Pararhizobium antarcticum TaxID=1798805 RepID=A0A657LJK3_9HYPH|nr:hypothetical protein [Pararhizobium antarcticum]OJF89598.1 hypothetical protein AX760_24965 [Pararhizobium antarcticum]OJF89654.1 hypothetical protein AX761_24195 [Rhizobium sp. 58]
MASEAKMSSDQNEWKPAPGTSHYFDPLIELDMDDYGERLRSPEIIRAAKIEEGPYLAELKVGMTVTARINRRTLDRKYIDKPFLAINDNIVLLRERWGGGGNASIAHLLSFNEYAFYDAQAIIEAI